MRDTSLDDFIGGDESGDADGAEGEDDPGDGDAATGADWTDEENETDDTAATGRDGGPDPGEGRDHEDATDREEGTEQREETHAAGVEPAVSTYDWTPDGASCDACATVVEARWRDDGVLVCSECKSW